MQVFVSRIGVSDELDMEGRSAFMWAAGKGADEAIRIWVKHGVDIHQVDKNGGTGTRLHDISVQKKMSLSSAEYVYSITCAR